MNCYVYPVYAPRSTLYNTISARRQTRYRCAHFGTLRPFNVSYYNFHITISPSINIYLSPSHHRGTKIFSLAFASSDDIFFSRSSHNYEAIKVSYKVFSGHCSAYYCLLPFSLLLLLQRSIHAHVRTCVCTWHLRYYEISPSW